MTDIFSYFKVIYLAYHFIYGFKTQLSHDLSQFLYNEFEKIYNMIRITGKSFS